MAHCLFDKETGARRNPPDIKFLAGWRNGWVEAYRCVKQVVAHPDYVYRGDSGLDRVAFNVALIPTAFWSDSFGIPKPREV